MKEENAITQAYAFRFNGKIYENLPDAQLAKLEALVAHQGLAEKTVGEVARGIIACADQITAILKEDPSPRCGGG